MIEIGLLMDKGATVKHFEAKDVIFHEGSECVYYHQLISGKVVWENSNEEGREFIQHIIRPGECFGELPLFDDEVYAADAIALESSRVMRMPKADFLALLRELPDLHFKFSRMLAQRVRFDFMLLKSFAFENPEKRIHSLLQYIKKNQKNGEDPLLVDLTRQQIANMTGLRVETVIRAVISLKNKGVLRIEQGKVYV